VSPRSIYGLIAHVVPVSSDLKRSPISQDLNHRAPVKFSIIGLYPVRLTRAFTEAKLAELLLHDYSIREGRKCSHVESDGKSRSPLGRHNC